MSRTASIITAGPSNFRRLLFLHSKRTRSFHLSSKSRRTVSFLPSLLDPDMKVAVIGCGIAGAICAATLAEKGVAVTVFETGRGPGGRTSQRREITEDGKELLFDHGAPFFSVDDNEVVNLVSEWEARGLVAEWKENFGCFDQIGAKFIDLEKEAPNKRYVGIPGMNSICKALCLEPGVETKFGVTVGKLEWLKDRHSWLLSSLDGENLGHFDGVVATDKNIASPRLTGQTGRPPPLDPSERILEIGFPKSRIKVEKSLSLKPCLNPNCAPEIAMKLQQVPARSCFALMLAFSEPLLSIPIKGFSFRDSKILSWAFCENSKPGRSHVCENSERWVLHSTDEYAKGIIAQSGLQKPSKETLLKVAGELFQEFQSSGLDIPQPFFMKAHRWGSAFPDIAVAGKEKCLCDRSKRLAICGDFCLSPSVEGAILSGKQAATDLLDILSCL